MEIIKLLSDIIEKRQGIIKRINSKKKNSITIIASKKNSIDTSIDIPIKRRSSKKHKYKNRNREIQENYLAIVRQAIKNEETKKFINKLRKIKKTSLMS